MAPNFSDLVYFLEAARVLNFSKAAQRLGITQPSLSTAISRLEKTLGVALFVRGKTGVTLTKAGQRFQPKARELIETWNNLKKEAHSEETVVEGVYSIGCHPSVALYSLPALLPKLLAEHPKLEIWLSHDLSRKITEDVVSSRLDFGIVINPTRHPDLVIRRLSEDVVTLWTRKNPTENQKSSSASKVLILDPDLLQAQSITSQLQKAEIPFDRVVKSSNLEVIAELVASGAGLGILPTRVAQRVKSHSLVPYSKNSPNFTDELALVYRADSNIQRSMAGRLIIEAIMAALGDSPKRG